MKRNHLLVRCVAVLCAGALSASAEQPAGEKPAEESSEAVRTKKQDRGPNVFRAFRKGGRGLTNIASSPLEIPNQMVREARRHDTFGGAIGGYITGIPVGCGWMFYRLGTGLFDLLTFPAPLPTYEKSYIQPEYLFPLEPRPLDYEEN